MSVEPPSPATCPVFSATNYCLFEDDFSSPIKYQLLNGAFDLSQADPWTDAVAKMCSNIGGDVWKGIVYGDLPVQERFTAWPNLFDPTSGIQAVPQPQGEDDLVAYPGSYKCFGPAPGSETPDHKLSIMGVCIPKTNTIESMMIGDPSVCCWQNFDCEYLNQTNFKKNFRFNSKCFDTPTLTSESKICPTDNRRLGGSTCLNQLKNFCIFDDPTRGKIGTKWAGNVPITDNYIINSPCAKLFFSTLYSQSPSNDLSTELGKECYPDFTQYLSEDSINPPPNSIENFRNAQELLTTAVTNYLKGGGDLASSRGTSDSNYEFNQLIFKICSKYPNMCQPFLPEYCSKYTLDDLAKNPNLVQFCGCYLSESANSLYTDTFQINPECTPTCNLPGVIPLPKSSSVFEPKICQQSICVLNNINLDFVNSKVGGQGLTLGNFCSTCTNSTCSCILENLTFTAVDSTFTNLNISQQCGSTQCYSNKIQADGTITKVNVACESGSTAASSNIKKEETSAAIWQVLIIVLILAIVIFLLWWLYFLFVPSIKPSKNNFLKPSNIVE